MGINYVQTAEGLTTGKSFAIDEEMAKLCVTVCELADSANNDPNNIVPVPLSQIRTDKTLQTVIEWMQHYKENKLEEKEIQNGETSNKDISEWDLQFLPVQLEDLYDIINSAKCLGIEGLWTVGCKRIAKIIEELSPEEVRTTFNIKNDFTPEEEAEVRRQNEWAKQETPKERALRLCQSKTQIDGAH